MSYIEENIMEGEEIIHETNTHWKVYIFPLIIIFTGVGYMVKGPEDWLGYAVLLFIFGLIIAIRRGSTVSASEFVITNKEL